MVVESKNDGGAAFPESVAITPAGDIAYGMPGMSLRDWFAGQALSLVGLLAIQPGVGTDDGKPASSSHFARAAYDIADAMLAERSK